MIKSITLENFKSYKKAFIRLSEGMNAFVGDTDAGKSALVSAIKWVVYNRPLGDSMCSDWGGITSVTLEVEKGSKYYFVGRSKGNGKNIYSITDQDGNEEIFEAFGTSVPDEVVALLRMSEINCQWQHDSHFMISGKPREAGMLLNKVTDLDVIDKAISNINKIARRENGTLTELKGERKALKLELSQFDLLGDCENEFEILESKVKNIVKLRSRVEVLKDYVHNVKSLKSQLTSLKTIIAHKPEVERMLSLCKERDALKGEVYILCQNIAKVHELRGKQYNTCAEMIQLERELANKIGDICPLCGQPILRG